MASKTGYTVTWREGGKPMSAGPFRDIYLATERARELSVKHHTPVLIEERVRYIHARWEGGKQTLARSMALPHGMEL